MRKIFIGRVTAGPTDDGFAIGLHRKIANMIALAADAESVSKEPYRSSVKDGCGGALPPTVDAAADSHLRSNRGLATNEARISCEFL